MPAGLEAIPPAQVPTSYQALVKLALRSRQKRVFALALVAAHALQSVNLISLRAIWHPASLLASLFGFAFGIIPLLVARKRLLSSATALPTQLASTRAEQFSTLVHDPAMWTQAALHGFAFSVLAVTHCLLVTALSGTAVELAPQTWIASHHAYFVNERFLFIVGSTALLGAVYGGFYRNWPADAGRPVLAFDAGACIGDQAGSSLRHRVARVCEQRLPLVAVGGACSQMALFVGYVAVRRSFWRAVLAGLGHRRVARRLLVPSFRVPFTQLDLVVRAAALGAIITLQAEIANILLEVYLSQPLPPLSKLTKDPNSTLLDGISDPIIFFSQHACSELSHIAAHDGARRVAIFKDVHGEQSAWSRLSTACLQFVDAERKHVSMRGARPPAPSTATAAPSSGSTLAPPSTSEETIWDALARGQVSRASKESVSTSTTPQPREAAPVAKTDTADSQPATRLLSSVLLTCWKLLPADARHALCPPRWRFYIFETSVRAKTFSIAGRDSARLACSVVAIKQLLEHSLNEDPFGSVQKDIRKVLTALVNLSTELRALRLDLESESAMLDDKLAREQAAAQNAAVAQLQASEADMGVAVSQAGGTRQSQEEFSVAWQSCGAAVNEALLRTAIKGIVDTFARFNLGLEPELQARLSTSLEAGSNQDLASRM